MDANIIEIKERLASKGSFGLAVDVDETLSFTLNYWFHEMARVFGNPEGLEISELIKKYRYFQNVPYWQTSETYEQAVKLTYDNELQKKLAVIGEADKYLPGLHLKYPVLVYLTTRPVEVISGTRDWLKLHGFPEAEIICRPATVHFDDAHPWKAEVLEFLAPNITGLIDDNYEVLKYLQPNYQGNLFFYSLAKLPDKFPEISANFKIHFCPNWSTVVDEVTKTYLKLN
jgi:hypothetical protein